jgi:P-type Ca2+ transporter type 2C
LALATDQPSSSLLNRKPDSRKAPIITTTMWKMIWIQAIAQIFITFFIYFYGGHLPYIKDLATNARDTLIFNIFVWMQIFNCINCRRIDNHKNILEGMAKNWMFAGILAIMCAGQILIVFVGGQAFAVVRLDGIGWGISLVLGLISIPLGFLARLIPDAVMARIFGLFPRMPSLRFLKPKKSSKKDLESVGDAHYHGKHYHMHSSAVDFYDEIAEKLTNDLKFYRQHRGRRLALLRQGLRRSRNAVVLATHGSGSRSRSASRHSVLSAIVLPGATVMASGMGRSSFSGGAATPASRESRTATGEEGEHGTAKRTGTGTREEIGSGEEDRISEVRDGVK